MRQPRMTITEVENFLNETEDVARSLKDPWELDGETLFDPETLLDTIIMKGGQLTPLYTNVATFYRMNRSWWNRHKLTFQKWWEVIDDEYTPLWDRDGFEETTDQTVDDGGTTGSRTSTEVMDDDTTSSETGKEVVDGTDKRTVASTEVVDDDTTSSSTTSSTSSTTTSDSSTTHDYVSAFDSGYDAQGNPVYQPNTMSTTTASGNSSTTSSGTASGTGTDDRTTTTNGTDNLKTDKETDVTKSTTGTDDRTTTFNEQSAGTSENTRDYTHQHHSWGNWGISTTAQRLLEQELRIRTFDIYEHMADFFLDELAIRVYV